MGRHSFLANYGQVGYVSEHPAESARIAMMVENGRATLMKKEIAFFCIIMYFVESMGVGDVLLVWGAFSAQVWPMQSARRACGVRWGSRAGFLLPLLS